MYIPLCKLSSSRSQFMLKKQARIGIIYMSARQHVDPNFLSCTNNSLALMKVDLLVYFCMRRWSLLDRVQCADHCNHLNYNLLNNVIFSTTNEHTLKKK